MIPPDEVLAAHSRIARYVRRTPALEVEADAFGSHPLLALKLELMQHAGSFKPRGAFNRMLAARIPPAGVVAASGGNHGIATAYAARTMGVRAEIFVPEISAPAKQARLRELGATLHVGGARYADALDASRARAAATGALEVHAYEHEHVLAGQGTLALEWEAQLAEQRLAPLDTVLIAVGGGGLIGGAAAWWRDRVRIIGVEPATSTALHSALAAGRPVPVEVSGLAADSLGAREAGTLMFPLAQAYVERVVLVEDDAIRAAQRALWRVARIAAEPGGATALAAILAGAYRPAPGERVGVLVCGGNVDPATLA